jgi:hypothetical protein
MKLKVAVVLSLFALVFVGCSTSEAPRQSSHPNVSGKSWIDNFSTALLCGSQESVSLAFDVNQTDDQLTGTLGMKTRSGNQYLYNFTGHINTHGKITGTFRGTDLRTMTADLTYTGNAVAGQLKSQFPVSCGSSSSYLVINTRMR